MKKTLILVSLFSVFAFAAFAANPVTVDSAGGGDYTRINVAIAEFALGGANAGETPPLIINVDPTGTYDEVINLSDGTTTGAIVGDLVIQSSVPGTLASVSVQNFGGDGITIHQGMYDVTFNDLLLKPSIVSAPTDDFIKIDENAANGISTPTVANEIWFNNCVFTDVDVSGVPAVTSKADFLAMTYPDDIVNFVSGSSFGSGDMMMKWWNDAGENLSGGVVDCVFWIQTGYCARININGNEAETFSMEDCLCANAADWHAGFEFDTNFPYQAQDVHGTGSIDDGDLSDVTAVLSSGWHAFWTSGVTSSTLVMENIIADVDDVFGTADNRPISGGSENFSIKNASFNVTSDAGFLIGFPTDPNVPDTWENISWHGECSAPGAAAWFYTGSAPDPGALNLSNWIVTGDLGAYATSPPAQGINVADFVENIGGLGPVSSATNVVTADPKYLSMDTSSADYMNASAREIAGSGSDGYAINGANDFLHEDVTYELVGAGYGSADGAVTPSVSAADLLNGKVLTVTAGGWHASSGPAASTDAAKTATLVDGAWAADGVTVLPTDAANAATVEVEYDFLATDGNAVDVDSINIFAGHDDATAARGFINATISLDTGAGYAATVPHALCGDLGDAPLSNVSSVVTWTNPTEDPVQKLKITFWSVSHNSTNFFQKHNDITTAPPSNYPNQSTILKEIDVIGSAPPSKVGDWFMHD